MKRVLLVFGGLLAFCAAPGDARQPEGAMGRMDPGITNMTGWQVESGSLVVSARVERIENYDAAGLETFLLHLGGKDGAVTVLGDADVPLIRLLLRNKGQRVAIEIKGTE